MKKYYSPTKPYTRIKRFHPFYKLILFLVRIFFPKNELVWKTEKPADGEPLFFVCNHTKLYAPTAFLLQKPKVRVWGNYYFIYLRTCWHHMRTKVLKTLKYGWLLYPLAFLLTPFIVLTFRAIEPIPVFHFSKKVINITFAKSIETAQSNMNQVVFPERTKKKANDYVYEFNRGFPLVALEYYNKTGKKMKFYPVYCASKLHKLLVGKPIEFNPEIPMKLQRDIICKHLEDTIKELGDSLPKHEIDLYIDEKNEKH